MAIALAVLVLLPAVALAHASFDVRQLPAASSQELVLRVPLERHAVNDRVEVLFPGAFTIDACDGAQGWRCDQGTTADGDTVLTFERAPDGPGDTEHFALTATAPDQEGVYAFPTIQTYDDGEEAAWIGEPGSDRPAPRIQVGDETTPVEFSSEATPHTESDDEPRATPTATPAPVSSTTASPSGAATDEPTGPTTGAPGDGDASGGTGEVVVSGAVIAAVAAVAAAVVGVAAVLLRRRGT